MTRTIVTAAFIIACAGRASAQYVDFYSWFGPGTADYISTTDPAWNDETPRRRADAYKIRVLERQLKYFVGLTEERLEETR